LRQRLVPAAAFLTSGVGHSISRLRCVAPAAHVHLLLLLNLSLPFCNLPYKPPLFPGHLLCLAARSSPPFHDAGCFAPVSSSCICTVVAFQAHHTLFSRSLKLPTLLCRLRRVYRSFFKTSKKSHSFLPTNTVLNKESPPRSKQSWTFSEHATSDIDSVLRYCCIVREQGFGASLQPLYSVREPVDLFCYTRK
jgi:hypothetical protein